MSGKVPPVKVSPIIKTSRYALLLLGLVHGTVKYYTFKAIESREKPRRKEKHMQHEIKKKIDDRNFTIAELTALAKDFEVTEFPPGWSDDV